MAEEKKFTEEKHYDILTRESIRVYGESAGHADIPDDVAGMLGEDVSYRLRAIAQVGAQFMRHSRRRRMTTEDINKALRNMDVQPVFGHGSLDPQPFQQTREGEIHFVEDMEVNFSSMATNSYVPKSMGNTSIKSHWLAIEGVSKSSPSQQQSQNPTMPGKPNLKPDPKAVSGDLLIYYENITKAILGCDEELTKTALDDLRTNNKLVPLLPYFVNFVSNGVKTISYDITQLTKLLHTVKALIRNPHLYLEPKPYTAKQLDMVLNWLIKAQRFDVDDNIIIRLMMKPGDDLTMLVQAVLYCILEPLAASINPLNDHWFIRDYAARLLAQIISRWKTPVNQLFQSSLQSLKEALHDLAKPSCSHYGAVMGVLSLGPQVVEDIIIPHLPNYWPHLQTIMEDTSVANALAKADAHKVYGAILLAVEFLIKKKLKDFQSECSKVPLSVDPMAEPVQGNNKVSAETGVVKGRKVQSRCQSVCDFYTDMYKYFGDSLAMRLPKLNLQHIFKPTKKETIVNLRDTEMDGKTGEDLLEDFMEQVRIQQIKEEEERKKREELERLQAIERAKQLELMRIEHERQRRAEEARRKKEAERRRHLEELRRNDLQQRREQRQLQEEQANLMRHPPHIPLPQYSYPVSDPEDDPDIDVEETSDRSPDSEKSEEKSEEEQTYFPSDPSHMDLTVKSTVSDPRKGSIKLTISKRPKFKSHIIEERGNRVERSDKHKDKEYKHSKKRKQSQRSPRESSRSPYDPDRNDIGEVKRRADFIYQFDAGDHMGKFKNTTAKRPCQREEDEPDNYELVDRDRSEKLTIKLTKSKFKGPSASQGSPNYS